MTVMTAVSSISQAQGGFTCEAFVYEADACFSSLRKAARINTGGRVENQYVSGKADCAACRRAPWARVLS
jgi:hypothetical protein